MFNKSFTINNKEPTPVFPNQLWTNGISFNDQPKNLAPKNTHSSHLIYVAGYDLRSNLQIYGVVSYIDTRKRNRINLEKYTYLGMGSYLSCEPYLAEFTKQETLSIKKYNYR